MRARLALRYSGIRLELREVVLREKPAEMLAISPKGTVPILQLEDGRVIDESWDIMLWALQQHDPGRWLANYDIDRSDATRWVAMNDYPFKAYLDLYKYADRHPQHPASYYRDQTWPHLQALSDRLGQQTFLSADQPTLIDYALLPFIRQFAHVDIEWFRNTAPIRLVNWMDKLLDGELFRGIMQKYPPWANENEAVWF